MKAEIITIGDEILIGQIVDTNSAWMGQELNNLGIDVYQITSVHDNREHILAALHNAKNNADIVLLTGGLGPTKDDITKQVLCEFFNCTMHYDNPTILAIEKRLAQRGIPMIQLNKDQALVPDACTVLANSEGTAPGMWFEKDDTVFISMPGVPYEMKSIMTEHVLPKLATKTRHEAIYHQTTIVYGVPESLLSEKLNDWENNLPENLKLAYLPNQLLIRLRISSWGNNIDELKSLVKEEVEKLRDILSNNIFSFTDESMGKTIGKLLVDKKQTISVAESCTGGSLAYAFTSNQGASAYFKGGIVAYENNIKEIVLGVKQRTLQQYGAVSNETAVEMVKGIMKLMNTDFAIATTGIAGPDGGTPEKPVGTVCIAVAHKNKVIVEKYHFNRKREHNIERTIQTALYMLKSIL
ncbi:MAG: competence/damage-inducible protein A [Mangrovibacterium sp.]